MSTPIIQVQPIDHITLIVADLEQTRQFYVDLLGMTEVPRPAFDFDGKWFAIGSTQIHATIESDLAGRAGWGDRGVKSISRGHHFAFPIADANQACLLLKQNGIEIASGPKKRPDGVTQVYVYDPDRHLVELFSD